MMRQSGLAPQEQQAIPTFFARKAQNLDACITAASLNEATTCCCGKRTV